MLLACCSSLPFLGGPLAFAQTPAASRGSDEIVVTAERRARDVADVPITITALTGEELQEAGVTRSDDLTQLTPGLQVSRTGSNGFFFLRGVGTSINPIGADTSIALYVDGIYQPRSRNTLVTFLDIDRVEVLKGPQGTLYGRNAAGGAINIISKAPEAGFSGVLEAGVGDYNALTASATINIPLVGDTLIARASIQRSTRDGYVDNVAANASESELESEDILQGRAQLLYRITPNLDFLVSGYSFRDDGVGAALRSTLDGLTNYPRDFLGAEQPSDPRTVSNDFVFPLDWRTRSLNGKLTWDIADDVTLTVLGGQQYSRQTEAIDRDDTAEAYSSLLAADKSVSHSLEAVLTYPLGDHLELTSGVSYFQEKDRIRTALYSSEIANINGAFTYFTEGVRANVLFYSESYGVFTQGTYSFRDDLRFTGGVRYSFDEKEYENQTEVAPPFTPFFPVGGFGDEDSWDSVTFLTRLEHDINPKELLFVSYSKGFKSGGFNTNAERAAPAFEPETLYSLEVGYKGRFDAQGLTFNASAFYYDYSDIQVQISRTGSQLVSVENAAGAEVYGVDLDATFVPTEALLLSLGAEFLHSEYKDYFSVDTYNDANGLVDLSGEPLTRAPEVSLIGSAVYTQRLGSWAALRGRVDWSYRSDFTFRPFAPSYNTEPGYHVVNAALTLLSPSGSTALEISVKNAFDELYRANLGDPPSPDAPGNIYAPPRTVGLTLRRTF